jgi:hypothetical protein
MKKLVIATLSVVLVAIFLTGAVSAQTQVNTSVTQIVIQKQVINGHNVKPTPRTATLIYANPMFNSNPTVVYNKASVGWGFEVVPVGQAKILSVPVTVTVDSSRYWWTQGKVTQVKSGTETIAFTLPAKSTACLALGQHTLIVKFAGNSQYAPSTQTFTFTVLKQ